MGTIYIGVTSNLRQRVLEHRAGFYPDCFTNKYNLRTLVWYQGFGDIREAIAFETRIKRWKRDWKLRLVIDINPDWIDLFYDFYRNDGVLSWC
ncbi:MAG: GIY-YIG nuclease family protein [Alphaproteobacteria bacterium]|nr:GIY-YIG nuclease family protein [Alphaproteobacteria bacterium]